MRHHSSRPRYIRHALSIPVIYSVIIPVLILDIWVELYHRIAFALYGIPYVQRGEHVRVDRAKLRYLAWYDRINCAYCGYVNGLFGYVSEIAARTEEYWCGIKHAPRDGYTQPSHHANFIEYGDEASYKALGVREPRNDKGNVE